MVITSSSPSNGVWLSLAMLVKLTAYFGDHRTMTIDRAPGETSCADTDPMAARLLHDGRVVALVHDERLAAALIALLDSVPHSLQTFAEIFVDVLRQHSDTDESSGICRECGQPAPCGTRVLLQDRISTLDVASQRL